LFLILDLMGIAQMAAEYAASEPPCELPLIESDHDK
jgi:hypothetical protein